MKNSKWLIVASVFLTLAFSAKLNAQDFGVKGSIPPVYAIGGGFQYQIDNLNFSPEAKLKDYAFGTSVYVKGEIKKYIGTTGLLVVSNIRISLGYEWWGSKGTYSYYCFNNNIIPAIELGFDYKIYDKNKSDGFFVDSFLLGIGLWNEFVFGSKFIQNENRYNLSLKNPYTGRLAIVAGLRGGWRDFELDLDVICGVGNPYRVVEGVYDHNYYRLNSPIFCFTLGFMKKYHKY